MKVFLSIILSLLVLVCATSKAWVFIAFKLNQSYIAAELCENRFETLVLCSGACYLDKQLEALDQKEQPSNSTQQVDTKDFHFPSLMPQERGTAPILVAQEAYLLVDWQSAAYTAQLLKPPRPLILS